MATCWVMVEAPAGRRSGADVFQIAENGANDTDVINPRMAVKLFVFCGDKGIFDLIGNLVNRNENTFFNRILHQQLTVAGVKPRGDGRFIFGQLMVIRQLAGIFPQRTDNQHDGDDGKEKNVLSREDRVLSITIPPKFKNLKVIFVQSITIY